VEKTAENQLKEFSKHTFPPLEVIMSILEQSGRREEELAKRLSYP